MVSQVFATKYEGKQLRGIPLEILKTWLLLQLVVGIPLGNTEKSCCLCLCSGGGILSLENYNTEKLLLLLLLLISGHSFFLGEILISVC